VACKACLFAYACLYSVSHPQDLGQHKSMDTRTERSPYTMIDIYLNGERSTENCAVICDRTECDQYVASLWDWLEGLGTGIQRNNSASWTPDRWPPTYRGILNTLEVAHQAFVWRVRKQKRVCKVQG